MSNDFYQDVLEAYRQEEEWQKSPQGKAAIAAREEQDRRIAEREALRIHIQRARIAARKKLKAEWTAGVAKILYEARRREAARATNPFEGAFDA